ncbi:molybdenum transport ATP-binding protein ModC [Desulfocucumis palustris]|uniref:Molybdenum transport ATP-binding protein ModC n=1 Tax=Desulfocucumis palustris TaxID=1898651 RepID=A0A2L2XGC9_9FIRM|nr:ATP-binding cassette domain-containing protein [Desulfocucumis palustris]GBF35192.1 molybdenum transport ATP-binding protein ModC [Desulfocucumis palustris]
MNTLLEISGLHLNAGKFALKNINISMARSDYFMVLGPTGCGKTLLLETIAGLYMPAGGAIILQGRDITRLPPEQRSIGLAYQDSLLYPFLTVKENILFGSRGRGKAGDPQIRRHLEQLVEAMNISGLLDRYPAGLSGGERQRVSLARAIVKRPPLLLLDEPLSALDPRTRGAMQELLRQIHLREGLGIIHVTHDFTEAMQLGTCMAVLKNGAIEQRGAPCDIFFHPATVYVAGFLQGENLLAGTILTINGRRWFRQDNGPLLFGPLPLDCGAAIADNPGSQKRKMLIRAGNLRLGRQPPESANSISWTASVSRIALNRTHADVYCHGSGNWQASLSLARWRELQLSAGERVNLWVNPENLHIIPEN